MIKKINEINVSATVCFLINSTDSLNTEYFTKEELSYINECFSNVDKEVLEFNRLGVYTYIVRPKVKDENYKKLEKFRTIGDQITQKLNTNKVKELIVVDNLQDAGEVLAFCEGVTLSNYQFIKYFNDSEKKKNSLADTSILSEKISLEDIEELNAVIDAQFLCRDLINEPLNKLNAVDLAERFEESVKSLDVKVEIFNKNKIEALKMGGLLAVNRGSIDPPTFTILEYKPKNAVNDKPYVLVGKGVVYDTGGMNLKPGPFMDNMKSDMSGAAAMGSVVKAVAKAKLPIHVIGLIPATDNRVNGNAMVSGDVITISNGKTVEVLNTDAEGRLILADALSYASKLNPELVIDMATLTGAAVRAIGPIAVAGMQVKAEGAFSKLKDSGFRVYERIVEFPMWEEYGEWIKSDIADMKNLGPAEAGMITAGKFLENFTDYPYIHLDIAGPAFLTKKDSYRGNMATGVGVRLLFDFLKNQSKLA